MGENTTGPRGKENASFGDGGEGEKALLTSSDALRPCFDLGAGLWYHHRAEPPGQGSRDSQEGAVTPSAGLESWHPYLGARFDL